MHFREVVERSGLLRVRQLVATAVVLDRDVPFFDVDVRRAVLPHRAQLDEVALRRELANRKEQVQRADDVVDLGEDGVLAVDHRVGGSPLLGEMDDRIRAHVVDAPTPENG